MARSKSSGDWLRRHFTDPYVKRAQAEGVRSRAIYKLLEIQEKDHLIQPGMNVVDLGAAPGGWSEAAVKLSKGKKGKGKLFALDILPMEPLEGVVFIQGDFREETVLNELQTALDGEAIDVVMSDIAPNMTGQRQVDQPRIMYLAELVLEFALQNLKPNGSLLVKVFQGEGFEAYLKELRANFAKVVSRKPDASRDKSREIYLLAKGRR